MIIRLGTRGSALALYQTNWVKEKLQKIFPEMEFETIIIKTTGDKILDSPLSKIGDKGLFTKELDRALLDRKIDIAVHSMKDVPTQFDNQLTIAAVTERHDVRDALVSNGISNIKNLPQGATIATGSLRRKAQLLHFRPDFNIIDIRGNVNTRLKKFDQSDWDAMVLAVAGLERLELQERISQKIPLDIMLPAVGQGCFAVMTKKSNQKVIDICQLVHQPDTSAAVFAERAFLRRLEGGCQVPLGAIARVEDNKVFLKGCVCSLDGQSYFGGESSSTIDQPEKAGEILAESLLKKGASRILEEIRKIEIVKK
jgi:hydroxymethylbilane synthase